MDRIRRFCIRSLALVLFSPVLICDTLAASPCVTGTPRVVGHATPVDARTLRLQDGRTIRLVGLEVLQHDDASHGSARSALDASVKHRDLALSASGKPDRYGRFPAFAVIVGQTEFLQESLVRAGHFAAGFAETDACTRRLQALEAEARNARRGVWAETSALKNTETTGDFLAMMGRFVVAEGKVLSARQAGAIFYINFGRRWTRDFAVTIARRDMPEFEKAGISRLTLEGKTVRVRGWVVDQRGSPRIQATKPVQVEIVSQQRDRIDTRQ